MRNILFITVSSFITSLGNWAGLLALTTVVYHKNNSIVEVGLLYAAKGLGYLLSNQLQNTNFLRSLPFSKKLFLLDILSAILIFTISVFELNIFLVILIYFILSIFSVPYKASIFSSIKANFSLDDIPKINAKIEIGNRLAFLSGPAIMGFIINSYGTQIGLLIDAASYLIAGLMILNVSFKNKIPESEANNTLLNTIKQNIPLTILSLLLGASIGVINISEVSFSFVVLGGGEKTLGYLITAAGIGSLFALFTIIRFVTKKNYKYFFILSLVLSIISTTFLSLTSDQLYAFILVSLIGFCSIISIVAIRTYFMEIAREDELHNLMTLRVITNELGIIIGSILGSVLVHLIGSSYGIFFSAIIKIIVVILAAQKILTPIRLRALVFSCISFLIVLNRATANISNDRITILTSKFPDSKYLGLLSTESESSFIATSGTYETLVKLNDKNQIIPVLAENWNFKNQEIIFNLRKDVQFSDGTKLEATHVINSFNFLKRNSEFTNLVLKDVKKIIEVNKYKISIQLKNSAPGIISKLAFFLRIYPLKTSQQKSFTNIPGSGPWKLKTKSKTQLVFEPHDMYWNKKLRTVNTNSTLIYKKMPNYTISQVKEYQNVILDNLNSRLLSLKNQTNINLYSIHVPISQFGIFNLLKKDNIFHSTDLRKAINIAIDRTKLNKLVFKKKGIILPSLSIPGENGSNNTLTIYKYDLTGAKKIVNKLKLRNRSFTIGMQSDDKDTRNFAKFLIKTAKNIGLNGKILSKYQVSNHLKYTQNVDIVLGSDPSPYGHFDFLVNNFFEETSPFYMSRSSKISSVLKDINSNHYSPDLVNKKYSILDKIIHSNYYGIPGIQYILTVGISPTLYSSPYRFGLLDLSEVHYELPTN